ncbi:hypothetical protein NC652_012504 [Populus alba x Populus x berolinensis]|nr:hypothetical protein NC652_012504 [Populus alba x Populus x berolinensis]
MMLQGNLQAGGKEIARKQRGKKS